MFLVKFAWYIKGSRKFGLRISYFLWRTQKH